MQTHCRQRGGGGQKGPKTAYILKECPLPKYGSSSFIIETDIDSSYLQFQMNAIGWELDTECNWLEAKIDLTKNVIST